MSVPKLESILKWKALSLDIKCHLETMDVLWLPLVTVLQPNSLGSYQVWVLSSHYQDYSFSSLIVLLSSLLPSLPFFLPSFVSRTLDRDLSLNKYIVNNWCLVV